MPIEVGDQVVVVPASRAAIAEAAVGLNHPGIWAKDTARRRGATGTVVGSQPGNFSFDVLSVEFSGDDTTGCFLPLELRKTATQELIDAHRVGDRFVVSNESLSTFGQIATVVGFHLHADLVIAEVLGVGHRFFCPCSLRKTATQELIDAHRSR